MAVPMAETFSSSNTTHFYPQTVNQATIIDFLLLRTLRNLHKNEIRGDTEIGQNIIIFSILDKSRSVAPVKREIKLVVP